MHARQLDRLVTFLRGTETQLPDLVQPKMVWADLLKVNAAVTPVSDGERLRAGESLASMKSRFVTRWSPKLATVDPRDRISYGGRIYDINGVKEIGRRQYLEFTASARAERVP